jgi:hypothetical protein
MANQQRRRYTKEFKEQAVELTYSRGKQLREVEEDLGINASMLGRWRREMKENPYACFSGAGNVQHLTFAVEDQKNSRKPACAQGFRLFLHFRKLLWNYLFLTSARIFFTSPSGMHFLPKSISSSLPISASMSS